MFKLHHRLLLTVLFAIICFPALAAPDIGAGNSLISWGNDPTDTCLTCHPQTKDKSWQQSQDSVTSAPATAVGHLAPALDPAPTSTPTASLCIENQMPGHHTPAHQYQKHMIPSWLLVPRRSTPTVYNLGASVILWLAAQASPADHLTFSQDKNI